MRRALALSLLLAAAPWPASGNPFAAADPATSGEAPRSPFRAELVGAPDSVVAGAEVRLRVSLRVPAAHHVYAERTTLEVLETPGLELLGIETPQSESILDPITGEKAQVFQHDTEFVARVRPRLPVRVRAVLSYQGCSEKFCFFPQSDTLSAEIAIAAGGVVTDPAAGGGSAAVSGPGHGAGGTAGPGPAVTGVAGRFRSAAARGLPWVLFWAFVAGLATSLTPCIYPMIPITIGVIGARSAGRRSKGFTLSLLYVLGIAVTYSALGTSAALTGSLFGSVLQNTWVLAGIALVFVVMAMSMFGAFELQVPTGIAGRLYRVQGSGYPGAFLLGLVAGVVASPCVGPVLVAMLAYVAASGKVWLGFAIFFVFALGLGVLFVVLGTFTGLLAGMPRSGNWMVGVKIVFGLVFLGVAIYYLHPLLPHPRGLAAFGAGSLLLGLGFALGGLRAIHETEPKPRRWRKALGRAVLVAGAYALIVPLLPRTTTHNSIGPRWLASEPEGLRLAAAQGKPMLVDFGAEWCGACKELERDTFSDPRVIERSAQFVAVRVDATRRTPEIDRLTRHYGIVGLPWVAFVAPDGTLLKDLTVTGFIDADAMLSRMARALPAGAASRASAP